MIMFGNFNFSPYDKLPAGRFCPGGFIHRRALIVSLSCFDCLGVKSI